MRAHADQQIIVALRNGEFGVLDQVYRDHASSIRNWIVRNNGTSDDAQDVFQDAIIALHQKANDPDFVLTCPLGGLLFSICRNKWLNQLRKKNKEAEVRVWEAEKYKDESSLVSVLEQVEEEQIRQERLDHTFQQLSELCQKLLRLLISGLSSAEVAVQLGMTDANTVYRRKNACVGRWRTLFQAQN
ncbi:MAG: RNA polymerase sigma factor [Bacteroidota bacterium]